MLIKPRKKCIRGISEAPEDEGTTSPLNQQKYKL
jgi:hypothetical protein